MVQDALKSSARAHAARLVPTCTLLFGIASASNWAWADPAMGPHAAVYPVLNEAPHVIATGFEVAGVSAILPVGLVASVRFACAARVATDWISALSYYRADLERGVLLGLELLVAADIVGTVAIAPTFSNLGVLAIVIPQHLVGRRNRGPVAVATARDGPRPKSQVRARRHGPSYGQCRA